MKLKKAKWIMLASVILFYAFIYLATSKVVPVSEFCAKANTAGGLIKRSYVYGAGCCGDTAFCINVKDTIGVVSVLRRPLSFHVPITIFFSRDHLNSQPIPC